MADRTYYCGNVLKDKNNGSIIIITNKINSSKGIQYEWVSFSDANCSGMTAYKSYERDMVCFAHFDVFSLDDICTDIDCDRCHGTGHYTKHVYGLEEAEFLGDTVKDYIIKSLTKNFNF